MKKHLTIKIFPHGEMMPIETDEPLTLEEYQAHVGGYIERIPCIWKGEERDMIVNENGKDEGLPTNSIATTHYRELRNHGYDPLPGDYIAGNVLILTNYELP